MTMYRKMFLGMMLCLLSVAGTLTACPPLTAQIVCDPCYVENGDTVVIDSSASLTLPNIQYFQWDLNYTNNTFDADITDNDHDGITTFTVNYANPGTYTIAVKVTGYYGQTSIATCKIYVGDGASGNNRVVNVTRNWWYSAIQGAVSNAQANDVLVAFPGTYYENVIINGKTVTLTSKNPKDPRDPCTVMDTIIDANHLSSGIVLKGTNNATRIDGFVIKNGKGTIDLDYDPAGNYYGGGIFVCVNSGQNDPSPVISKCIIEDNWPAEGTNKGGYGGGICFDNCNQHTWSNGTVVECIIRNNQVGDISQGYGLGAAILAYYYSGSSNGYSHPTILRCEIYGNVAKETAGGGVVYFDGDGGHVEDCVIRNNKVLRPAGYSGGVAFSKNGFLKNSIISGNLSVYSQPSVCVGPNCDVANCVIEGNVSRNNQGAEGQSTTQCGGGIVIEGGNLTPVSRIYNCTIVGNSTHTINPAAEIGGIQMRGATLGPDVHNCIVERNISFYAGNNINAQLYEANVNFGGIEYSKIGIWVPLGYSSARDMPDPCAKLKTPYKFSDCTVGGSINGDPETLNVWTGEIYMEGDIIELDGDGIARRVTWASTCYENSVPLKMSPPKLTGKNVVVRNWGPLTGYTGGETLPKFDWHLLSASPCIDAGDNSVVSTGATDIDGDNRRINDPNTADTGNGTAPIVDMGADEYKPVP